jgi:hypothetical protein
VDSLFELEPLHAAATVCLTSIGLMTPWPMDNLTETYFAVGGNNPNNICIFPPNICIFVSWYYADGFCGCLIWMLPDVRGFGFLLPHTFFPTNTVVFYGWIMKSTEV